MASEVAASIHQAPKASWASRPTHDDDGQPEAGQQLGGVGAQGRLPS